MLGYFVTAPMFGYLGDRMTRKWLIAAGILVWSLGTVLSGVATGFGSLLGYRVLVGLGEASYATISPSLISDAYGPARRNNALTDLLCGHSGRGGVGLPGWFADQRGLGLALGLCRRRPAGTPAGGLPAAVSRTGAGTG